MTPQELAQLLNGREYREEITDEENKKAKEDGLVVVFGYSDDNTEFRGAIDDEFGCFNGAIFHLDQDGIIPLCDCQCKYWERAIDNAKTIEAKWCDQDNCGEDYDDYDYSWVYDTKIPHATFDIFEEGGKFCRGIVFHISSLA